MDPAFQVSLKSDEAQDPRILKCEAGSYEAENQIPLLPNAVINENL